MDFSRFFTFGLDTSQALPASYDPELVITSYLISALAGFAFLRFTSRIIELGTSVTRYGWMTAGALTMGLGVWAMHFVGMLAYRLPIPVSFDAAVTAFSAVPAVLGSFVALHVVARPVVTMTRLLLGGVLMGAGIVLAFAGYTLAIALLTSRPLDLVGLIALAAGVVTVWQRLR